MKLWLSLCLTLMSLGLLAQTKLDIITIGHPTLRAQARELNLSELSNRTFQTFLDDMVYTMKKAGGIGLAAPQVNESIRVFVMKSGLRVPLTIAINPTIEYLKEFGQQDSVEGCLSIPGQTSRVKRYKRIRLSYFDRNGNYITEEAKGMKAIIAQHEYDHLNGVLIVDLVQQMFTELNYQDYVTAPLM